MSFIVFVLLFTVGAGLLDARARRLSNQREE